MTGSRLVVGEYHSLEMSDTTIDILIRYDESDGRYNTIIYRGGIEVSLPFHVYHGILSLVSLPQPEDYV